MSLKNTLLESSSQKTRSPIFPCPYSRASSSQVQLHLDNRFLGNSNSPLTRTKSDSLGFTSYIYCKFNFENPKPRSQQCFVAHFLCISPMIPVTASDFMLCLSEIQSPNAVCASIFRQLCGALLNLWLPCKQYRSWANCFGGAELIRAKPRGIQGKNPGKVLKFSFLKSLQMHRILKSS